MAATRSLLSLAAILLLAGGIVMEFFIVLSGSGLGTPVDLVYFLQSTTTGINGAPNPARWTYLALCEGVNDLNANCGSTMAGFPFDPASQFTGTGVPELFQGTNYWYYLSRVSWAFYVIALFFAVLAFFSSVFAPCARLGAYLAGVTTFVAVIMQSICSALHTAWVVKGRNAFNASGQEATIGKYAMGFTWGIWAAYFLASVLFVIGGAASKSGDSGAKKSYFGRKASTRSRGSFLDAESQRRSVKDEYE